MTKKNATARLIHFLVGLFIACLALALILALAVPIGFYGMAMYLAPTLPSTQEIKPPILRCLYRFIVVTIS